MPPLDIFLSVLLLVDHLHDGVFGVISILEILLYLIVSLFLGVELLIVEESDDLVHRHDEVKECNEEHDDG